MKFFVLSQVTWSPKFLITDNTNIIFNSMMNRLDMNIEILRTTKGFSTKLTHNNSLAFMNNLDMIFETTIRGVTFSTNSTFIISLTFMSNFDMSIQIPSQGKSFLTMIDSAPRIKTSKYGMYK